MSFPIGPSDGNTYTTANGSKYIFNSAVGGWQKFVQLGGIVYLLDPVSPNNRYNENTDFNIGTKTSVKYSYPDTYKFLEQDFHSVGGLSSIQMLKESFVNTSEFNIGTKTSVIYSYPDTYKFLEQDFHSTGVATQILLFQPIESTSEFNTGTSTNITLTT